MYLSNTSQHYCFTAGFFFSFPSHYQMYMYVYSDDVSFGSHRSHQRVLYAGNLTLAKRLGTLKKRSETQA